MFLEQPRSKLMYIYKTTPFPLIEYGQVDYILQWLALFYTVNKRETT